MAESETASLGVFLSGQLNRSFHHGTFANVMLTAFDGQKQRQCETVDKNRPRIPINAPVLGCSLRGLKKAIKDVFEEPEAIVVFADCSSEVRHSRKELCFLTCGFLSGLPTGPDSLGSVRERGFDRGSG